MVTTRGRITSSGSLLFSIATPSHSPLQPVIGAAEEDIEKAAMMPMMAQLRKEVQQMRW